MIANKILRYVGPRAIFDPMFIPPELLFRKKEETSLFSILHDSIMDRFTINILYQGIQGIGKRVIVKKVIKDLLIQNKNYSNVQKVEVECKEKSLQELIIYLIIEINKKKNVEFDFSKLINFKVTQLWSILKLICRKFNDPLFILFNNIEHLKDKVFSKFSSLSKETNVSIISTVNKIYSSSNLDSISNFDLKKKLDAFNYKELHSILRNRASLTFQYKIDEEIIDFITDLTCEHYAPVPGKGIDLFRDIYPLLKNNKMIDQNEMREICQNHFDTFGMIDEFALVTYFSEEDLLKTLLLDNLSNFFLKNSTYYIKLKELKKVYEITCENLEYEKNLRDFYNILENIYNLGILNLSRKMSHSRKKEFSPQDFSDETSFYMVINPFQLKSIVDVLFGKI